MPETIIGITALERRFSAIAGPNANREYMGRVGIRMVAALRTRVPRKTGNTGRSFQVGNVTANRVEVRGSSVARFIDEGTGLYGPRHAKIVPKNKKALAFTSGTFGKGGSLRLTGKRRKGAAGRGANQVVVRSVKGMHARPFVDASVKEAAARSGLAELAVERWSSAA